MTENWYVLRSKRMKERSLFKLARSEGHEVYLPQVPLNPVNPRARKVGPYFPGYMFVRADLAELGHNAFRWMPFSLGLVWIGGQPAPVHERFIHALHRRIRSIHHAGGLAFDDLQHGDRVTINEGAFEGYRAIFDQRLPGTQRARVLLQMLSDRFVPAEIDAGALEKES